MHLSRDPECSADTLTNVISKDQALTANLLKLCNSAYYGIPRTIASVKQAIMFLGFHTVRNLVLTSTMREMLDGGRQVGYWYAENGLWRHSIAVAFAAQILGKKLRPGSADASFTAGLLHDVGKLVMFAKVGERFAEMEKLMGSERISIVEAERRLFGYDHAVIGAKIADHWNFPAELFQAIGYHHEPDKAKGRPLLVVVAHVANCVAQRDGYGMTGGFSPETVSDFAFRVSGLKDEDLDDLAEKLSIAMEKAPEFVIA
jgi:putative nucleotidyltransferase with HDIG domain